MDQIPKHRPKSPYESSRVPDKLKVSRRALDFEITDKTEPKTLMTLML